MAISSLTFNDLSADERIELMGRLWNSLDPAIAAPITPALAAELDRREAEADADPDAGQPWDELKSELEIRTAPSDSHTHLSE